MATKTEIERLTIVETKLDGIDKKLDDFMESSNKRTDDFIKAADKKYADQQMFNVVKSLVFGMVGLILTGVLTALLALVIQ